ncbi:MAG TPA: DoxX family membrane protein [Rudaea sp.]
MSNRNIRAAPGVAESGLGRPLLGLTMAGLGIVGLVTGEFASVWQRIPIDDLPGRPALALATAAVELLAGLGLLFARTVTPAARTLVVFVLLWLVLLKLPAVIAVPQMEATWLGFGEIAVIFAGAWIVFARHAGAWERARMRWATGSNGVRAARWLFTIALPMIGLSHFFYDRETASFVPQWLPSPYAWAYLTGAGSLAACAGLLFGVLPRVAATLEAAMLVVITVLVWTPYLTPAPVDAFHVTGFLISSAIACGAWVVADSYRASPWLSFVRPFSLRG